jgi:hypothetical protein
LPQLGKGPVFHTAGSGIVDFDDQVEIGGRRDRSLIRLDYRVDILPRDRTERSKLVMQWQIAHHTEPLPLGGDLAAQREKQRGVR